MNTIRFETVRQITIAMAMASLIAGLIFAQPVFARPSLSDLQQQIDAVEADVGTLKTDVDTKQNRITGVCPPGSSIGAVNANGSVVCEADDDTTYSAGDGLDLQGTTFSVRPTPAFRVRMPFGSSQTQAHNTEVVLNFSNLEYDSGNNYDVANRQFVAPETGFYHLNCSIMPLTAITSGNVRLQIGTDVVQVYGPHPAFQTISISTERRLFSGEQVSCRFYTNANGPGNSFSITGNFARFSGFRIN